MPILRSLLLSIVLPIVLAACGPGSEPAEPPSTPPPVKDTAFGDMVGTMDKARAVEATTMQHKEDLDRSLQDAEGR